MSTTRTTQRLSDDAADALAAAAAESLAAAAAESPPRGRPWYRDYWPWLLMLPPAASVAGGLTMIYLATSAPAALVVDDYARIEEITSARFARAGRAAALGLEAVLDFALAASADASADRGPDRSADLSADRSDDRSTDRSTAVAITLTLTATDAAFIAPGAVILKLRHATSRDADRELVLARVGAEYFAQGALASGRYAVEIVALDASWRLGSSLTRVPGTLRIAAQAGR